MSVRKFSTASIKTGTKSSKFWDQTTFASQYFSIATATVGSGGSSSVTFSSIPSTYTHLQIRAIGRTNRSNTFDDIRFKINGDTATSYYVHFFYGDGASVAAGSNTTYVTGAWGGGMSGATATSSVFGAAIIDILDYANTNKNKTIRALDGVENNGSGTIAFSSSLWSSTSAINSIELFGIGGTIQQYSSFALYGIKA